jgi:hypothetical protein
MLVPRISFMAEPMPTMFDGLEYQRTRLTARLEKAKAEKRDPEIIRKYELGIAEVNAEMQKLIDKEKAAKK